MTRFEKGLIVGLIPIFNIASLWADINKADTYKSGRNLGIFFWFVVFVIYEYIKYF